MTEQPNLMITDVFIAGARKGWNIATTNTVPNILMAFVLIKAMSITGALDGLGYIFNPLMQLVGLPGESAAVLIGGWMSMGGGIGVAISLYEKGILTGAHLAILTPSIYLMGSQLQYLGRILGVIGTHAKLIPVIFAISVLNAFIAMFIMNILI